MGRRSGSAEAHSSLGLAYWAPSIWGFVPAVEAVAWAKPVINTALALDDTLSAAHFMAGWIARVFDWDWARAEREFLRAIELDPSFSGGHIGLAWYYLSLGRFDDGIREMQEAIDLDPLNLTSNNDLSTAYANAGRYEEAITQRQKVLEMDPAHLNALWHASADYIRLSRHDEAVELIERAVAIHRRLHFLLGHLVWAHAAAGRKPEAEALLAELHARDRDEYVAATNFALAYAALVDMDEAFRWIDQALEDRDFFLTRPYSPIWDLVRGDPRFLDMLRRINYPAIEEFKARFQPSATL